MSKTIVMRGLTLSAVALSLLIGFAHGVRWARSQALTGADCWERKPMPFCELMGSPIGGRIAIMPDIVVSTDP